MGGWVGLGLAGLGRNYLISQTRDTIDYPRRDHCFMYPGVIPVFGASDGEMETAWSEVYLSLIHI